MAKLWHGYVYHQMHRDNCQNRADILDPRRFSREQVIDCHSLHQQWFADNYCSDNVIDIFPESRSTVLPPVTYLVH